MQKTKEVLLEICPNCGAFHRLFITNGIFDFTNGKNEIACTTIIGYLDPPENSPPPEKKSEKPIPPTPILCGYKITSRPDNTFIVKRWTYAQRIEYYNKMDAWKNPQLPDIQGLQLRSSPETVKWVLQNGVEKSPLQLTDDKIGEQDGVILEALHGAILSFNAPPLSQSSVSQLQSIRQTPLLPMGTS